MIRHASVEELAKYDEDDLRPRKRARITAHLGVCIHCSSNHERLHAVANILADVSYPPMPEHLSAKISVAISSESAARVASEPATEAGRLDLPERKRSPRPGSARSRLSSPLALRLVAATGAVVVVAGAGYAIATGVGSTNSPSSSSGAEQFSRNAAVRPALKAGSVLRVNVSGRVEQIKTFHSTANFSPQNFKTQTVAAINAQKSPAGSQSGINRSATVPAPTSNTAGFGGLNSKPSKGVLQLQACVGNVASGGTLELVMSAHFEHRGATIIVVRPAGGTSFKAYAVGSACSGTDKDILYSIKLPRL